MIAPKLLTRNKASFLERESLFIRTILESVPPEAADLLTLDRVKDVQESSQNGRPAIPELKPGQYRVLNFIENAGLRHGVKSRCQLMAELHSGPIAAALIRVRRWPAAVVAPDTVLRAVGEELNSPTGRVSYSQGQDLFRSPLRRRVQE